MPDPPASPPGGVPVLPVDSATKKPAVQIRPTINTAFEYGPTIAERVPHSVQRFWDALDTHEKSFRVALPAIVQSFDEVAQTVDVKPAITEFLRVLGEWKNVEIPVLQDLPIVIPRAGGYSVTLPVKKGDECLVVFGDMCMDAWWQNGGIQSEMEKRRHDLNDGFAVIGTWSQPNVLENYSTTSAQVRSDDGTVYVDLTTDQVTVKATTIILDGDVQVTGDVKAGTVTPSTEVSLLNHIHSGVQSGLADSGPPVPGT